MARGRKPGDGRGRLGGRTKGTPNKTTKFQKEMIQNFIDENWEEALEAWHSIDNASQKWIGFTKLFEYIMPKYSSVELKGDGEAPDFMKKILELRGKQ